MHASRRRRRATALIADITAASAADLELVPGKPVHYAVKATEVMIYPAPAD